MSAARPQFSIDDAFELSLEDAGPGPESSGVARFGPLHFERRARFEAADEDKQSRLRYQVTGPAPSPPARPRAGPQAGPGEPGPGRPRAEAVAGVGAAPRRGRRPARPSPLGSDPGLQPPLSPETARELPPAPAGVLARRGC